MWNTCWLAKSLSMGYTVFWHPTQVSFIGNWNFYKGKRKFVNWKTHQLLGTWREFMHSFLSSQELQSHSLITVQWGLVDSKKLRQAHGIAVAWQGAKISPQWIPQLKHHMLSNGWERTMRALKLSQFPKAVSFLPAAPVFIDRRMMKHSSWLQSVWDLPK